MLSGNLKPTDALITPQEWKAMLTTTKEVDVMVSKFWEIESIGVEERKEVENNPEILENLSEQIKFREGRYEVKLPWKEPGLSLPSNEDLARKSLNNLVKKLNLLVLSL